MLRRWPRKFRDRTTERPLPPVQPRFHSRFGGLWTDLNTARDLLAGKVALGLISESEAELVGHWIDHGYVVIPRAADETLVDQARGDLEACLDGRMPRPLLSYWDEEETKRFVPARRELVSKREAKILDLHRISPAVQRLIFSEPIRRFLHLVFERPALAFQTLTFLYGSEQSLHQDSAYVRVTSPLELVASWIALEDIEEGSGELTYYPGSHRLPEWLFDGQFKWAPRNSPELECYSQRLRQRALDANLKPRIFRPRRGDALIWSADLIHGGTPRSKPGATRRSIVTHYCPVDQRPTYFQESERRQAPGSDVDWITGDPSFTFAENQ